MNKYEEAIQALKYVSYDDYHSTTLLYTHAKELEYMNDLVERATPKKVTLNIVRLPGCPNCGSCNDDNDFCYKCGQALLQGDE